ncbi:hypothetical protein P8452_17193 [Trifolium repens]|nr:hypothetical protein P8452_17193 [Trifolium repens]
MLEKGVLRTNYIDCLDCTNAVNIGLEAAKVSTSRVCVKGSLRPSFFNEVGGSHQVTCRRRKEIVGLEDAVVVRRGKWWFTVSISTSICSSSPGSWWQVVVLGFGPFFRLGLFCLAWGWLQSCLILRAGSVGVTAAFGSIGFWDFGVGIW